MGMNDEQNPITNNQKQ